MSILEIIELKIEGTIKKTLIVQSEATIRKIRIVHNPII